MTDIKPELASVFRDPKGDELDRALTDAFGPLAGTWSDRMEEAVQVIVDTQGGWAEDTVGRVTQRQQASAALARRILARQRSAGLDVQPADLALLGPAVDLDVSDGRAAETFVSDSKDWPDDVPFDGGTPVAATVPAQPQKAAPKKRATRKAQPATPTRGEAVAAHDAKAGVPVTKEEDMFSSPTKPAGRPKGAEPGESALVRRDQYGRYMIPLPPADDAVLAPLGKDTPWTRATTMAKSISDTYVLDQWGNRMVAKGIAIRPDLRALAAATSLDDRDTLNKIAEDAKNAAGAKVRANLGTAMHTFTESVDRGEEVHASPEEAADLRAYRVALADAGVTVLADYMEKTVVWPAYGVAGTFDRIVQHDGELVIGDLKTGRDLSYGWGEIAIQLAIYSHATHIYDWATGQFIPMPKVSRTRALVFHLPVGEARCVVYEVDLKPGLDGIELCYQVRAWRKTKSIARPLSVAKAVATPAGPPSATLPAVPSTVVTPPSPMDRVRACTTKGELSALWNELHPLGQWSDELTKAGKDQLSKFATA